MPLSAEDILKHAGVLEKQEVHVPKWAREDGDDVVLVRGMTIREYELNQSRAEDGLATASIVARCAVDSAGSRLFTDAQVNLLAELGVAEIDEVWKVIADLSGITPKAKADAEENSPAAPSGDSSSDLPVTSE
jgi:hypothetical protein